MVFKYDSNNRLTEEIQYEGSGPNGIWFQSLSAEKGANDDGDDGNELWSWK